MQLHIQSISCPNCGAPQSLNSNSCSYCGSELIIRSLNSINAMDDIKIKKYISSYNNQLMQENDLDTMLAIALCYIKLKIYSKAAEVLNRAMNIHFDDPNVYFYAAICIFQGKRPFLVSRSIIDKAESFLNAALELSQESLYYYFLAYIRYDYHYKKGFNINPNYQYYLQKSKEDKNNKDEKENLYKILNVEEIKELL